MEAAIQVFWNIAPYEINPQIEDNKNIFVIPFGAMITDPSSTGNAILGVNGKTGKYIFIDYNDVEAEPRGSVQQLKNLLTPQIELKSDKSYVDSQDSVIAASVLVKADKDYVDQQDELLNTKIDLKADAQSVNQALGTKADLVNGVIPANQLPSFVDDVLEFSSSSEFQTIGESGKIYVAIDTNKTYRWGGSSYVEIGGGGVALGETSATAYRGDRGKIAYDHSQSQGNPHNTTTSEIPEGTNFYFTEQRVRLTPLTGLTVTNSTITATDNILSAFGKVQGQISAVNQFSETKTLNTKLTGLSIPSSASDIVATDTIIQALAKLQKSISLSSAPVWVPAETIGTIGAKFVDSTYTKIEVARWAGQLLIRGYFRTNASVTSGDVLLTITDVNYKTINPSGANTATGNIQSYVNVTLSFGLKIVSSGTIMNATDAANTTQTIQANSAAGSGQLMFISNAMVSKLVT